MDVCCCSAGPRWVRKERGEVTRILSFNTARGASLAISRTRRFAHREISVLTELLVAQSSLSLSLLSLSLSSFFRQGYGVGVDPLSLSLFFLPSTGDKSASGPGPRPPRSPLFGGTGLWGVAGGARPLFIPRPLTLSRIPASSPRPLWHYP